jgi:hypothetical protein
VNCSCTWSKDLETDIPYLCVAGLDAKIKVYDVFNATIVKVFVGHGAVSATRYASRTRLTPNRRSMTWPRARPIRP